MNRTRQHRRMTRREALGTLGKAAAVTLVSIPIVDALGTVSIEAQAQPLAAVAGIDRVVMLKGKTYLSGWTGYGAPPRRGRAGGGGTGRGAADAAPPVDPGPAPKTLWAKVSGPGDVAFADATAAVTTATFSKTGDYVVSVTADNGTTKATSNLAVKVELPPPPAPLAPVFTTSYSVNSPFWSSRFKALIVNWIPHCIAQCNRTDLVQGSGSGAGGLDNFVEAGKALRGEPHGKHKGYVFSNAWVHQTVESICLALMVDPQGDARDHRGAEEHEGDARGLDSEDPRRRSIPTATCRRRSRCATRSPKARPIPPAGAVRGWSGGRRRIGTTTRATSPATSSSRPSITT